MPFAALEGLMSDLKVRPPKEVGRSPSALFGINRGKEFEEAQVSEDLESAFGLGLRFRRDAGHVEE